MPTAKEIISHIDDRLEQFFCKTGEEYGNKQIFSELFEYIEVSNMEEIDQSQYNSQVFRLRDLKNCIDTAYQDGLKTRIKSLQKDN